MNLLIELRRTARVVAAVALAGLSLAATAQVQVPSGWVLDAAKIQGRNQFHLVAEPVQADFGDAKEVDVSGYNGSTSGPVLVVNQGETFSVLITNRQRAWTSFAIHGLETDAKGTGLPGAGQKPIKTGETWEYKYLATAPGIYRYGPYIEHRGQEQRGLVGAVLVLAKAEADDQHVVLTVHDVSGQGRKAKTLLNGRNAPKINDIQIAASKPTHLHVLNMSSRPQSLQIPGFTILRAGVAGDTHTAPRQGASFTILPRAGGWWLYFADTSTKPFASAAAMPGMPGLSPPAKKAPRLSGLATKLIVKGASVKTEASRLVSSDENFGKPKRQPR
jgi:FtsP/CotA-like multicopper oxidase with cupredoxin domain